MEKEMASLQESASLFEVNIPDFRQLKQCRKEIGLLKMLWDYVFIVRTCIEDWKTTLWSNINVDRWRWTVRSLPRTSVPWTRR